MSKWNMSINVNVEKVEVVFLSYVDSLTVRHRSITVQLIAGEHRGSTVGGISALRSERFKIGRI